MDRFYKCINKSGIPIIGKFLVANNSTITIELPDGATLSTHKSTLEEVKVITKQCVIKPASRLMRILEDQGYKWGEKETWMLFSPDRPDFNSGRFRFCGVPTEDIASFILWHESWTEPIHQEIPVPFTADMAQRFLVEVMQAIQNLTHECFLYTRDIDEIYGWSDEGKIRIATEVRRRILLKTEENPLSNDYRPFCVAHEEPQGWNCTACGYGKRHGICHHDDSDMNRHVLKTPMRGVDVKDIWGTWKEMSEEI